MHLHIDEEDDAVFVDNTGNLLFIRCIGEIGKGGEWSAVYETDETTFLAALDDILTWRNRFIKLTDDTDTYVYFTGYVKDIVNIKRNSCVLTGNQSSRILEDYPANTNTISYEGNLRAFTSLSIQDYWDAPFGSFDGDFIVVQDQNPESWTGSANDITYRNAADAAGQTPDHGTTLTNTTKAYVRYDNFKDYAPFPSRAYGTDNTINYIYASHDTDGAGSSNDMFFFKFDFKVPKKQGTSFTKCTINIKGKTNHPYDVSNWSAAANFAKIYAYTDNAGGSKTEVYDFWTNASEWASLEQVPINNLFSDLDEWDALQGNSDFGFKGLTDTFNLSLDITSLINFTDEHYFYNKTAYNDHGYDVYDFSLYVRVSELDSALAYIASSGFVFFYVGMDIEYDAINETTEGLASITTDDANTLTLNVAHGTNMPVKDGWSVGDLYGITGKLSANLTTMFTNSSANSIFTFSGDTISDVADPADHTHTPLIRVLDHYAEISGRIWFEQNFAIKLTNTLTSSTVTLTEVLICSLII